MTSTIAVEYDNGAAGLAREDVLAHRANHQVTVAQEEHRKLISAQIADVPFSADKLSLVHLADIVTQFVTLSDECSGKEVFSPVTEAAWGAAGSPPCST